MRLPFGNRRVAQETEVRAPWHHAPRLGFELGPGLVQVDFLNPVFERPARAAIGGNKAFGLHPQHASMEIARRLHIGDSQNEVIQSCESRPGHLACLSPRF